MKLNSCINFLVNRVHTNIHQIFKNCLSEYNITPIQCGVLTCLFMENGLSPNIISEYLSIENSTLTGVLDRLEKKNLIYRTPDPNDRRAIKIMLTDEGRKLEDSLNNALNIANELALKSFSANEEELLIKLLNKLLK